MNNEETKLKEMLNKFVAEESITEEAKVLNCPICNERLIYLEPDGKTLYCSKCEKYFKSNDGSVGEETTSPYTDKKALY